MMKRRKFLIAGGALALAAAGLNWLRMGSLDDYKSSVAATRALLSKHPELSDLVRYATLAANGHNTQPWKFRLDQSKIEILPDFLRRTPAVDPDDHHLFVSLGCAAENLSLAANAQGRGGEISFQPEAEGSVTFSFGRSAGKHSTLFDPIPLRQSTRAEYDGRPIGLSELKKLSDSAASVHGVSLVLLTERAGIDEVRDLVLEGNSEQMQDPAFVDELKSWLRFNPREAMEAGDGLFSLLSGSPALPTWLGPHLFDLAFKAESENEKYARQIRSSAGLAIFIGEREDKEHWVSVGRACQRFSLQATALGLKHAFLNQPVEVAKLRPELAALIGMPGRRPDLVMRFGYGSDLPYSARRAVDRVMISGGQI